MKMAFKLTPFNIEKAVKYYQRILLALNDARSSLGKAQSTKNPHFLSMLKL